MKVLDKIIRFLFLSKMAPPYLRGINFNQSAICVEQHSFLWTGRGQRLVTGDADAAGGIEDEEEQPREEEEPLDVLNGAMAVVPFDLWPTDGPPRRRAVFHCALHKSLSFPQQCSDPLLELWIKDYAMCRWMLFFVTYTANGVSEAKAQRAYSFQ